MTPFRIEFFTNKDGTSPTQDFILSLEPKMRAKVLRNIDLLAHNGYNLREPYSKLLQDGILELRTKVGSNITRILYFFVIDKRIILSHGFIKKTQKIPPDEIERAIKNRKEYIERTEQNG